MIAKAKPTHDNCLTQGCTRPRITRGLCQYCYFVARKLIERKLTTWEELEAAGIARVKARRPFNNNPLVQALDAYREKANA